MKKGKRVGMLELPFNWVLASAKFSTCPSGYASDAVSPVALFKDEFEHPAVRMRRK